MSKTSAALREIAAKVSEGRRLSRAEGIQLYKSPDLLAIGQMADLVRERKHGRKTYFIVNRHINHTNICVNRCKLCAFGRDADSPGAYQLSLDQIEERAAGSSGQNIAEIHVVGGLNPDLKLDYYVEMMRRLRRTLPGVIIQSLTAVEIDFLAREHGLTHREVLAALREAGLDSLPGGGAEVFSPRVREIICPGKVDGDTWLEVHQAAHELGIRTNATMLYGHVETIEERIDHLLRLRELQDRTGGFLTIIPLAFHPKNTALEPLVQSGTTGYDDLKTLAVARLMLDNFDHVKSFWIMVGPKLAQVSLSFGVNDLDGTVVEERIVHDAGAQTEQSMTREQLVRLIKSAGYYPVQRDTLYNVVKEGF